MRMGLPTPRLLLLNSALSPANPRQSRIEPRGMIWSRPVATNPPDIILETEIMATFGGRERNRTPNLLRAKELRSQLRHTPITGDP